MLGLGLTVVVELAFVGEDAGHGAGFWHHIPLFDFAFGLASCWIIVVGSKAVGHRWLQRSEDYYAGRDDSRPGETE